MQRPVSNLHKMALLWVHHRSFSIGNPEERGVKHVDLIDEGSMADIHLALGRFRCVVCVDVEPVKQDFAGAVGL